MRRTCLCKNIDGWIQLWLSKLQCFWNFKRKKYVACVLIFTLYLHNHPHHSNHHIHHHHHHHHTPNLMKLKFTTCNETKQIYVLHCVRKHLTNLCKLIPLILKRVFKIFNVVSLSELLWYSYIYSSPYRKAK